jgi:hypothetical protein
MMSKEKTCGSCNHTLKHNTHGPDQDDYYYDQEKDEILYVGACIYCAICYPKGKWANYIIVRMEGKAYRLLSDEDKEKLYRAYNGEIQND